MITFSSYKTNLDKAEKDLAERIKSYAKDPNLDNVHALRMATRKMLAFLQLLPKEVRNGTESRKYTAKLERLLRLNTKVRHLDIAILRIPTDTKQPVYDRLLKKLGKLRESSIQPARRFATSLKNNTAPSLPEKELSDSTLQKRLKKTTERLADQIQDRLPAVLKDSKKQKALLRLRQDARMLRYTLELENASRPSESLTTLRSWQEVLAAIHDDDVIIERLQEERKSPETEALLSEIKADRKQNYENFRSTAGTKPHFKLETTNKESDFLTATA